MASDHELCKRRNMEEKTWKLYLHTNKTNGKSYVGITSKKNVNHRWEGGNGYKQNPLFYNAIQKYGWDGFKHEVLLDGLTFELAAEFEKIVIAIWHLNNKEYGYNLTTGGEGSPGVVVSEETRAKLSRARMKENLSEETLRRRSEGLKGRKFSDEHKAKIGASNSKKVKMFDLSGNFIQEFKSLAEAESTTGISHSHISQCCNGSRQTAGKHKWCFA